MGWAAPVANVVGALGGALIGRSSQNRAAQSQERATMAQIQLERDRDASRQRRYDTAMQDFRQQQQNYDNIRRAVLGHYGINLGGGEAPGGRPDASNTGVSGGHGGVSLGDLMGGPAAAPAQAQTQSELPAPDQQIGDEFDWRRYGVQ